MDAYDVGKSALLTYTKVQLRNILNDRLYEDEVYLANPPYTTQVSLQESLLSSVVFTHTHTHT